MRAETNLVATPHNSTSLGLQQSLIMQMKHIKTVPGLWNRRFPVLPSHIDHEHTEFELTKI